MSETKQGTVKWFDNKKGYTNWNMHYMQKENDE